MWILQVFLSNEISRRSIGLEQEFQMIVGFVDIGGIVDRSLSFHNSKCK
jgi:hypothetical protein